MAFQNKRILNQKTGQEIRFLQTAKDTGGKLLEMEVSYRSHSKEPPPHYHPFQAEDFTVISGQMTVRMNGDLKTLGKGDTLHVPKNTVHSMWNGTGEKAIVNWKVQPALEAEDFLETLTGLANDGKTSEDGMPGFLQVALILNKYSVEFRLAKPPFAFQRMLFLLLSPIAYLSGYRPAYKQYLD